MILEQKINSEQVIEQLKHDPLLSAVLKAIEKADSSPLSPYYKPEFIDWLFDDIPFLRMTPSQVVYRRPLPTQIINPRFWEIQFDNEPVLFCLNTPQGSITLFNRLSQWSPSEMIELYTTLSKYYHEPLTTHSTTL